MALELDWRWWWLARPDLALTDPLVLTLFVLAAVVEDETWISYWWFVCDSELAECWPPELSRCYWLIRLVG